MSASTPVIPPAATPLEELRQALSEMLGAERRLRGRDHQREGELTYAQVRAIATLGKCPEMTAGQIAKQSGLNPASVTALVDHLETAGYVERHRSAEDRRVSLVSLTPRGRALLEEKYARWQAQWQQTLAEFSDEELDAARRVLERVGGLFDQLSAKREPSAP